MSRLIARLHCVEGHNNRQTLSIRRNGSELRLSLSGNCGIPLSLSYANMRDTPPVFARGSDADVIKDVSAWVRAGHGRVVEVEAAPEPAGPGAESAEYRRGLEAALALCHASPTAHAFSVAGEILALLGRPIQAEAPARRRAPRRKPVLAPAPLTE